MKYNHAQTHKGILEQNQGGDNFQTHFISEVCTMSILHPILL